MKSIALWSLISGLTPFDVSKPASAARKPEGSPSKASAKAIASFVLATAMAALVVSTVQAGGLRGGVVNDRMEAGR